MALHVVEHRLAVLMRSEPSTARWPARRFVVCALALGLLYAFVNPPLAVNDERHHLIRAYKLSQGEPWAYQDRGGAFYEGPAAFSALVQRYAGVQGDRQARVDLAQLRADLSSREGMGELVRFRTHVADQFPLVYLPQTAAVWLASSLALPSLWYMYLARLSTLITSALLMGWAVSMTGRLRWIFIALGLMPMTLTEIAGLSSDALIIALSFVFFAMVARYSSPEEPPIGTKRRAAIICVFVLLVLCKPTCLFYALALPVVRWNEANDRRTRLAYTSLAALLGSVVVFAWSHTNRAFLEPTFTGPALEQAAWMLGHPLDTLKAWGRGLFLEIDDYVIQFVAVRDILSRQMRLSTGVIATLYLQLLLVLSVGALHLPKEARANRRAAAGWLSAATASYVVASYALVHLTVNEVGAAHVHGMQGRFLLPVAPAAFSALATLGHPIATRWLLHERGSRTLAVIIGLNLLCLFALVGRYYGRYEPSWPY